MTLERMTRWLARHPLRLYTSLALLYIALVVVLPPNQQVLHQYDLTPLAYHVLLFAVILPSLAVWAVAFYSYAKLYSYALSVTKTPEGEDFLRLASGCTWLAMSLPAGSILSFALYAIANRHPGFLGTSVVLSNYIALALPLIGFTNIGVGARGLVVRAKVQFSAVSARAIVFVFVAAGVLYCYLTFRHFDLASLSSTHNAYHLPIWIAVITIIIPYLYAWFVGLLAAYEMAGFSKQVKGVFYRQPLRLLACGISVVILSATALQYMGTIQPHGGRLTLDYYLALSLLFRIVGGCGYALIALAAQRLKRIEEV